MSINWDGFLMGVSDFGQERLKEERQKKMQQQLLELREKHEIAAEQRAEAKEKKKVVGSRDAAGQPGMVEDVNAFGEVVGTRSLDEFTRQQRERDAAKFQMEQANTQSQIDARKEELALRRTGLDIDRERNSLTRRGLESQAAAAASVPPNDAMEFVTNIMGFKAPTAGDAVGNRNWLKLQAAAEQALLWGELNNMSPENVKQRFRLIAGDPEYLETFGR